MGRNTSSLPLNEKLQKKGTLNAPTLPSERFFRLKGTNNSLSLPSERFFRTKGTNIVFLDDYILYFKQKC